MSVKTAIKSIIPNRLLYRIRLRRIFANLKQNGYFYYRGKKVYTDEKSVVFETIIQHGDFEPEIQLAMNGFSELGSYVFDVGANIGTISIALLTNRPDIHCVSIECSPSTLPLLKKTHQKSGMMDRWQIIEAAASEFDGETAFFTSGSATGAYDGRKDTGRAGVASQVTVNARKIDSIWEDLGRPNVSLIKFDIEGGEMDALAGSLELIRTCRPTILLEWYQENLNAYKIDVGLLLNLDLPKYEILALPALVKVEPSTLKYHLLRTNMFAAVPLAP